MDSIWLPLATASILGQAPSVVELVKRWGLGLFVT